MSVPVIVVAKHTSDERMREREFVKAAVTHLCASRRHVVLWRRSSSGSSGILCSSCCGSSCFFCCCCCVTCGCCLLLKGLRYEREVGVFEQVSGKVALWAASCFFCCYCCVSHMSLCTSHQVYVINVKAHTHTPHTHGPHTHLQQMCMDDRSTAAEARILKLSE